MSGPLIESRSSLRQTFVVIVVLAGDVLSRMVKDLAHNMGATPQRRIPVAAERLKS